MSKKKNLLIFENNLSFEITEFKENKFKKIYIVSNKNENRSIKLSEKLVKFKSLLMDDQRQRLKDKSIDCEVIDINEIKDIENCYATLSYCWRKFRLLKFKQYKNKFFIQKS
jgi:hypothetical protein